MNPHHRDSAADLAALTARHRKDGQAVTWPLDADGKRIAAPATDDEHLHRMAELDAAITLTFKAQGVINR